MGRARTAVAVALLMALSAAGSGCTPEPAPLARQAVAELSADPMAAQDIPGLTLLQAVDQPGTKSGLFTNKRTPTQVSRTYRSDTEPGVAMQNLVGRARSANWNVGDADDDSFAGVKAMPFGPATLSVATRQLSAEAVEVVVLLRPSDGSI